MDHARPISHSRAASSWAAPRPVSKLLVPLIGFLLFAGIAVAEVAPRYVYVGWIGFENTTADETITIREPESGSARGSIVVGGHASWQTDFCEASSEYVCFFSPLHSFAVPKDFDPAIRQWTVRGVKFELVKENASVSILGRRLNGLFVIKTPSEAMLTESPVEAGLSLYSPTYGLVGFYIDRMIRTYWVEGPLGFGALPVSSGAGRE